MSDPARTVLAGVLPDRHDHLLEAMQRLEPEHFRAQDLRNAFEMLRRYHDVTGAVMPHRALGDLLRRSKADPGKIAYYGELWEELSRERVEGHEFRWALQALRDQRSEELTGQLVTNAYEILERGWRNPETNEEFKGHEDARKYLWSELAQVDRLGAEEFAPEGDIRTEAEEFRREYADRKSGKGPGFVHLGIPTLDRVTGGIQAGEMALIAAYTSEGKSQLATQIAWHASVMQGKNVFFATSETTRSQVRRRLIARHSRLPEFGITEGLDSLALRMGTLSPEQEEYLWQVTEDLNSNPRYGKLHVAQVPRGGTLGQIEARLRRASSLWNVELVLIDYLTLLRADRRRRESRDELNEVLRDAKSIAVGFDSGRGIPIISPWPMSKDAYRRALQSGSYQVDDLGETSEAEKSSDIVLGLLRMQEEPKRVRVQVLKNRDGDVPRPFVLEADFRSSYLEERQEDTAEGFLEGL